MHLRNWPRQFLACAEPLEGRWCLSAPPTQPPTQPQSQVHLVHLEAETDDAGEREVAPRDLPGAVVRAFLEQFPGAKIVEADFSREEHGPEYGIEARLDGQTVEAAISPSGWVIEIERVIESGDIPAAVRNWVRENYPGAKIDEASAVTIDGVTNYDVLIAQSKQQLWEATLHVTESPSVRFAGKGVEEPAEQPRSRGTEAAVVESRESEPTEPIARGDGASESAAPVHIAASEIETREVVAPALGLPSPSESAIPTLAKKIEAIATQAPQVAAVMSEALQRMLPVDLARIERRIDEVADEIELLASQVMGDSSTLGTTTRISAIAALIAGLLLLRDAKKPKVARAIVANPASTSWSWVLGTGGSRTRTTTRSEIITTEARRVRR